MDGNDHQAKDNPGGLCKTGFFFMTHAPETMTLLLTVDADAVNAADETNPGYFFLLITSMPGTGTTNDENIRTLTGIFM